MKDAAVFQAEFEGNVAYGDIPFTALRGDHGAKIIRGGRHTAGHPVFDLSSDLGFAASPIGGSPHSTQNVWKEGMRRKVRKPGRQFTGAFLPDLLCSIDGVDAVVTRGFRGCEYAI